MSDKQRISKVTTRAGDSGNSKLATGRTVGKHEPIFQAIGAVDELNSQVGVLVTLLARITLLYMMGDKIVAAF